MNDLRMTWLQAFANLDPIQNLPSPKLASLELRNIIPCKCWSWRVLIYQRRALSRAPSWNSQSMTLSCQFLCWVRTAEKFVNTLSSGITVGAHQHSRSRNISTSNFELILYQIVDTCRIGLLWVSCALLSCSSCLVLNQQMFRCCISFFWFGGLIVPFAADDCSAIFAHFLNLNRLSHLMPWTLQMSPSCLAWINSKAELPLQIFSQPLHRHRQTLTGRYTCSITTSSQAIHFFIVSEV